MSQTISKIYKLNVGKNYIKDVQDNLGAIKNNSWNYNKRQYANNVNAFKYKGEKYPRLRPLSDLRSFLN